ncbi:hypothetical protein [Rosistilla oblonga]|uniref:hypothetical protein n=1 Tax=Rosistilla oblonga TaxID=2527990 RepID=UPI003A9824BF
MSDVPQLKTYMRASLPLALILMLPCAAKAQLMNQTPAMRATITQSAKTPSCLTGNVELEFLDLGMVFEGGSYVARFRVSNGASFVLMFPHEGYWTDAAIEAMKQPIAQILEHKDGQDLIEIEPKSPFEKRIVDLMTKDLESNIGQRKDRRTIKRLRDRILDRKPLREIQIRMEKRNKAK